MPHTRVRGDCRHESSSIKCLSRGGNHDGSGVPGEAVTTRVVFQRTPTAITATCFRSKNAGVGMLVGSDSSLFGPAFSLLFSVPTLLFSGLLCIFCSSLLLI